MRTSGEGMPNIASFSSNPAMTINEGPLARDPEQVRAEERNFDELSYKIDRNTKAMVQKILKAAEVGDDTELNSLLE